MFGCLFCVPSYPVLSVFCAAFLGVSLYFNNYSLGCKLAVSVAILWWSRFSNISVFNTVLGNATLLGGGAHLFLADCLLVVLPNVKNLEMVFYVTHVRLFFLSRYSTNSVIGSFSKPLAEDSYFTLVQKVFTVLSTTPTLIHISFIIGFKCSTPLTPLVFFYWMLKSIYASYTCYCLKRFSFLFLKFLGCFLFNVILIFSH